MGRRFERFKNISRVPPGFCIRLLILYIKKLFGHSGTPTENADNYYFLTLINTDCHSIEVNKSSYVFKNKRGTKFIARKFPSSDLELFNQVWGRDEYKKATDIVLLNPSKELIIIDAGANVGYTALFFYEVWPSARIYSIEPDGGNFSMLKRNIQLNNAFNIIPLEAGIWSHACNLRVDKSFRDNREWSFQVMQTNQDTGLKGMHILDVMKNYDLAEIDLLKIDIEGAEKYLFDGTEKNANFLAKTKVLAIEIHDEEIQREYVYDILKKNGFTYFDNSDLTIAYRQKSG